MPRTRRPVLPMQVVDGAARDLRRSDVCLHERGQGDGRVEPGEDAAPGDVEGQGDDSFPALDPPSWWAGPDALPRAHAVVPAVVIGDARLWTQSPP